MITKAIIEQVVNKFQYRVRIPIFDRINDAPQHTNFNELAIATACVPKGINNTLNVGDIVFVGFEDNSASSPIILGQLYREALIKENQSFLNITDINIQDTANLPIATTIGNYNLFNCLEKINTLEETVKNLEAQIQQLKPEG